eukprot:2901652-Pyramimonas_sp.AAC.1
MWHRNWRRPSRGLSNDILGPLGALVGASWAIRGPSSAFLGPSWSSCGPSWCRIEASNAHRKRKGYNAKRNDCP